MNALDDVFGTSSVTSRREAREQGLTRYFTGIPCANGHIAPRNVRSKNCAECANLRSARRYSANTSARIEYGKAYQKMNPEAVNRKNRAWRERNLDKDTDRNLQRRYGISLEQYNRMFEGQGGRCAICGDPPKKGKRLCVDHHHVIGNVRGLLCPSCNRYVMGMLDNADGAVPRLLEYLQR